MREKCPKTEFFRSVFYGPEKTPYFDTFHTVDCFWFRDHHQMLLLRLRKFKELISSISPEIIKKLPVFSEAI